ncbi:MAG: DUF4097 domain-containing protein [Clostridiaceae bacterium]|nr:DUF4097 domain-containing protein [Clostridiaceae bacterium]
MKTLFKVTIITACVFIIFGIALSIVAFVHGGRLIGNLGYYKTGSFEKEYTDVSSIDFDFAACDVKIKTGSGDTFKIKAKNVPLDLIHSDVENGKWSIEFKETRKSWRRFLGINLYNNMSIEITLPKDHSFDEAAISGGAAAIKIEKLHAKNVNFDIGAGTIHVDKLYAKELKSVTGVGDTIIEGRIDGDADISCSVGNVELELDNHPKDFNYKINVSIGTVDIEGVSLSKSSSQNIFNDADYTMTIDCSVGSVDIKFD